MALPNQPLPKPKKPKTCKPTRPAPVDLTDLEVAEHEANIREILRAEKRRLGR